MWRYDRGLLAWAVLLLAGCGGPGERTSETSSAKAPPPTRPDSINVRTQRRADSEADPRVGEQQGVTPLPKSLRIATYNINWGNPNLPGCVATIRQANADLVCLQETTAESEAYIRQALSKDYPHMLFRGHHGEYRAERFGFLSRSPLSNPEFVPPRHGIFGALLADISFRQRSVRVMNVHLQPFQASREGGVLGAISALQEVEQAHQAEIDDLLKCLPRDASVLIVGDFNSISSFAAPAALVRHGFLDSLAEVHENPEACITWHWPLKHGEVALRIDYVFHRQEFQTTACEVLRSDASDHHLVVSQLEWKSGDTSNSASVSVPTAR